MKEFQLFPYVSTTWANRRLRSRVLFEVRPTPPALGGACDGCGGCRNLHCQSEIVLMFLRRLFIDYVLLF